MDSVWLVMNVMAGLTVLTAATKITAVSLQLLQSIVSVSFRRGSFAPLGELVPPRPPKSEYIIYTLPPPYTLENPNLPPQQHFLCASLIYNNYIYYEYTLIYNIYIL